MKAEIKIPRGWRRLRSNEILRFGDRQLHYVGMMWSEISHKNMRVGNDGTYIRKRKVKK